MKKIILTLIVLSIAIFLFAQQEQYQVTVRNIEVPARVFLKNQFVNDLTIQDFEIYENGIPQKIEALYLTSKKDILRREELKNYTPQTARNFYLLFQYTEYDPKVAKSIEHFFQNTILPGDSLLLMTPKKKNYFLSSEALKQKPRKTVSKDMLKILKKDIKISSSAYRSSMRSLKTLVKSISSRGGGPADLELSSEFESAASTLPQLLNRYRMNLIKLEELRIMDQSLFLQFAAKLKAIPGQKYVYLFYEREFRPEISQSALNVITSEHHGEPGVMGDLQDLFQFYHRDEKVDVERIKNAYADAGVCFNFLFTTRKTKSYPGIYMREQSEDYFKAFTEVAKATGGIVNSSQNPSAAFMKALETTDNYYLLYYSPSNYKADGSYKNIEVKVKNKDLNVSYRQGYYAN
jgi:VWFA-related protein